MAAGSVSPAKTSGFQLTMQAIVAAIDVGYKTTKFTERVDQGVPTFRVFPSIAPMASKRDQGVGKRGKRRTVTVPVGDQMYEVGPDAYLVSSTFQVRNFDNEFVKSDAYLALCRGAMRFMRTSHIDLLVVGLPVSLQKYLSATLEQRLVGDHDLGDGRTMRVGRVMAMAQPMGALLSYALRQPNGKRILRQRNVVLDPGGRTFDWIVAQGVKPMPERSDAANKGMVDVVEAIGRSIADRIERPLTNHDQDNLDEALRSGTAFRLFGKPFDLAPHLGAGLHVVNEAITALRRHLQSATDVDNIIVAGGGTFFFKPSIVKAYPDHEVLSFANPLLANVDGFYLAGMEYSATEASRALRARPNTTVVAHEVEH